MRTPLEHLIPARRACPADDPIFALNAEAQKRAASGEAVINATVGALLDDAGQLVILDAVMEGWKSLTPAEIAPYAPIAGDPAFLIAMVQKHWPEREHFGVGAATPGGSGALSMSIRNFLEPGQVLLTAAPYWGPYGTLAAENGVGLVGLPWPHEEGLDLDRWRTTLNGTMRVQGRILFWLNDPCHNPTGLSLSGEDRRSLLGLFREAAALGPVTLLLDLAYLDYAKDPAAVAEAMADYAAFAKEGVVLVGAALSISKAMTLYGARCGALVFPWSQEPGLQAALATSCRGAFSNAPRAPQSLVVKFQREGKLQARLMEEQRHWAQVLESRATALDKALQSEGLAGCPWQGGFFVTIFMPQPEATGRHLKHAGVFTVPLPEGLRVGVCGLKAEDAPRFAKALAKALHAH